MQNRTDTLYKLDHYNALETDNHYQISIIKSENVTTADLIEFNWQSNRIVE